MELPGIKLLGFLGCFTDGVADRSLVGFGLGPPIGIVAQLIFILFLRLEVGRRFSIKLSTVFDRLDVVRYVMLFAKSEKSKVAASFSIRLYHHSACILRDIAINS